MLLSEQAGETKNLSARKGVYHPFYGYRRNEKEKFYIHSFNQSNHEIIRFVIKHFIRHECLSIK